VGVAQSNIAAQEAQIRILEQEKAYQRVVAPFDGVITQRNIDNGSLVTSGSTFMFMLMHPDVIRTQVYVPQDEAYGVGPGLWMRSCACPRFRIGPFQARVTRIATALQPGSRTLLTEIDVPNPDGALNPGIYCTVELFYPAQDAIDDHTGRRCRVRSRWPACRGGRERHRSSAEDHDRA